MRILILICALPLIGYSIDADLARGDVTNFADVADPATSFVIPRWGVIETMEKMGGCSLSYTYATSDVTGFLIQLVRARDESVYQLLLFDLQMTGQWDAPDVAERIAMARFRRPVSLALGNALFSRWVNVNLRAVYGQNFDRYTTGGTVPAQLISSDTETTGPMAAVAYGVKPGTEVDKFRVLGDMLRKFVRGSAEVSESDLLRELARAR
jgi:hypothetical protein